MKTLKGKATVLFSRERGLEIELVDKASRLKIKAVIEPMEAIAAMSRLAAVECDITYPERLERVGKSREVMTIGLNREWGWRRPKRKEVESLLDRQGYLKDGWELYNDGLSKQQNIEGYHQVVLVRWTDED